MTSPGSTKLPVGATVAAKYKITREIGRGGMASVYEAQNIDIGKKVAIKVLAQELTSSAVIVERFLREARAAAAIRSPHICDVYDSGRLEDGRPFLVLELLEGESLYERMTRVRQMDASTVIDVLTQVCRGLTKAHAANIVHRDLKPENIFLSHDEDGKLVAKILDFGLAKFYVSEQDAGDKKQQRLTREGAVFGTPAYMSPEQVRGQGAVDLRADLWALTCIAYECLTGQTVWSTDQGVAMTFAQIAAGKLPDPLKLRPMLPQTFVAWFKKGLSKDIEQRFQTARQLAEELNSAFNRGKPSFSAIHVLPAMPADDGDAEPVKVMLPDSKGSPTVPAPMVSAVPPAPPARERGTAPSLEIPITMTEPPPAPASTKLAAEKSVSLPPPPPRSGRNALLAIGIVGVLAAVGYAGYRRIEPGGSAGPGAWSSASSSASAPPTAAPSGSDAILQPPPAPTLPWQPGVIAGQDALVAGDHKAAAVSFKDARDKGGHGVPRTMLEHVEVFVKAGAAGQPCSLAGLARPRTYDITTAQPGPRRVVAGRPAITVGPAGPLMVWADAHEGPEHIYGVRLDKSLRPVSTPIDLTPEATAATRPEIVRVGDRFVLAWLDVRGNTPGIWARYLDGQGQISGKPVLVAPSRGVNTHFSFGTGADGHFLAVSLPREGDDSEDVWIRRLKPTLEPASSLGRVTDIVANGPKRPHARGPAIAARAGSLFLAYRMEREPERRASLLRVPIKEVPTGTANWGLGPGTVPNVKSGKGDRYVGTMTMLNADRQKADHPQLACGTDRCFAVWDGERQGSSGAFLDGTSGDPIWTKRFTNLGERPGVGVSTKGEIAVAWFEGGRIHFARANKAGVDAPTKFARVSGDQPSPSVNAGASPGEWLVAWLDFEAGMLEPYAARVLCR